MCVCVWTGQIFIKKEHIQQKNAIHHEPGIPLIIVSTHSEPTDQINLKEMLSYSFWNEHVDLPKGEITALLCIGKLSVKYLHSSLMYVISVLHNRQVWACVYLISSGAEPLVASMVLLLMASHLWLGDCVIRGGPGASLLALMEWQEESISATKKKKSVARTFRLLQYPMRVMTKTRVQWDQNSEGLRPNIIFQISLSLSKHCIYIYTVYTLLCVFFLQISTWLVRIKSRILFVWGWNKTK